jgi:hypothetical protein
MSTVWVAHDENGVLGTCVTRECALDLVGHDLEEIDGVVDTTVDYGLQRNIRYHYLDEDGDAISATYHIEEFELRGEAA